MPRPLPRHVPAWRRFPPTERRGIGECGTMVMGSAAPGSNGWRFRDRQIEAPGWLHLHGCSHKLCPPAPAPEFPDRHGDFKSPEAHSHPEVKGLLYLHGNTLPQSSAAVLLSISSPVTVTRESSHYHGNIPSVIRPEPA